MQLTEHTFSCGSPASDCALHPQSKWSSKDIDRPQKHIQSERVDELHQGDIVFFCNTVILAVAED